MKEKIMRNIVLWILGLAIILIASNTVVYGANPDVVVALDPGHGGNDPGAVAGGLQESILTWKITSRVEQILNNTPGIKAVLTKTENETVDLREERAKRAKANGADLLVSFHINSNDSSSSLSGSEVYITHNTKQKRYYEYSNILGNDILSNLRGVGVKSFAFKPKTRVGADWDKYPDGTVADYYGIISWPMHMDIPAVLVEHAFINNPYDREHYLNDNMLNKMAEADAKAIIKNKELFRRNYYGTINTELIELNSIKSQSGESYISGYINIAEWVGNNCNTPDGTPKITLKSTDGTINENMFVSHKGGLKYYFDKNIEKLDLNKEYYIEAELTGTKNTAPLSSKIQRVRLPNKILNNNYKNRIFKVINNKIVFSEGEYVGDIKTNVEEIKLVQNANKENYISGYVTIEEIVNGDSRTPKSVPEIRLKSIDGTIDMPTYISYQKDKQYYFDRNIQTLDTSKEYYLEATLITEDNISKNKTEKLILGNKEIGKFGEITVNAKNDKFVLNYKGTINTELTEINIIQNAKGENYISGHINIAEWINGECKTPSTIPSIILKSTDGTIEKSMFITKESGIKYYYDVNIEKLDKQKEYYIQVVLTNVNNIATKQEKEQMVNLKVNGEIGKTSTDYQVIVNNNRIRFVNENEYYGTINTELATMNIIQNAVGDDYISGYINIAEWVKGECKTPSEVPSLKLKSTDGKVEEEMFVSYQDGIRYYFDKNINGIDETKEYYIEVKLKGKNNIASEKEKTQQANMKPQGIIGICKNGNKVKVTGNSIKIEGNKYKGTINTELTTMNIIQNVVGDDYISGYINIAEWVDGKCKTPSEVPSMKLKSTDGKVETEMFVSYQEGIRYYFDKNIKGLDETKEYYIEVKLKGKNNIALEKEKTQEANIKQQGEIGTCTNGSIVKAKGNKIQIIKAKKENTIIEEKVEIKESQDIEQEKVQTEVEEEEIKEKTKEDKIEKEEQNNINSSIDNNLNNINNSNTTNNINKDYNNTINNIII